MASIAKRNEIFFHIASQMASRLNMMNLQIAAGPALLASPTIALEHVLAKALIRIPA